MRVMYVASNPDDADPLEIEKEANDLRLRLDRTSDADPIDFRVYGNLALAELNETIKRVSPDVLHFAAHGRNDAIILAHPEMDFVELDGPKLAAILGALAVKPKLIVINACSSEKMAADLASAGAADFVIGMDAAITHVAAREMAAALYQRLADAASIGDAFTVAATNLALVGGGSVTAKLHPENRMAEAQRMRLADPLRVVACFPKVELWLDDGLEKPGKRFRPELPEILFGLAGTPAASRQTVFFTDDETVQPAEGQSLEEARSWILVTQPIKGEIWMDGSPAYYGDMHWFGAVTTTDGRIASTASTTVQALRRYYFDEEWRGRPPEAKAAVIEESIACLARNDGSRRGRTTIVHKE